VNDHLKALEKKGYLRRTGLKSRALQLTSAVPAAIPRNGDIVEVPVIGRVAAGEPILAQENIEDTVQVDRFFIGRGKEVFALKVIGDSMIEDGIHDGDYIFVRQQLEAEPGGIVVAMIEGEATVKRYFPEGELIRFQPSNAEMDPILVRREDFRRTDLIGVVVGVYRKYS
jgi:repressor LexA